MMTTFDAINTCEATFAQGLGFESFDDLIEASEPLLSSYGELWFILELPEGHWLAWPFPEWDDTHRFSTREDAIEFVQPSRVAVENSAV